MLPEEDFCRAAALLSGNVDLRSCYRFGEGKFGIFHHDASQQRNEEDAEGTAEQHQDRRLPVGVLEIKDRPCAGYDECRDREDCARSHRLSDGAHGSGNVLFEDRALHQAQNGHTDNRGRIGGGDGHAGAQAKVSVRGAEDYGEHQAEQHGPERKLRHGRVIGNVGTELFGGSSGCGGAHVRANLGLRTNYSDGAS